MASAAFSGPEPAAEAAVSGTGAEHGKEEDEAPCGAEGPQGDAGAAAAVAGPVSQVPVLGGIMEEAVDQARQGREAWWWCVGVCGAGGVGVGVGWGQGGSSGMLSMSTAWGFSMNRCKLLHQ